MCWAGRMPFLLSQACVMRSQKNILPLSFSLSKQGVIQGEESLRDAGEGTGRPIESASLHPDSPRVEPHLDNSSGKLYAFSCLMLTISGMLPCDEEWSFDYPGLLYS